MGSIRSETYEAGGFLIERLRDANAMAYMLHDGGDIMLFQLPGGERVSVQFIESGIPLYEIRGIIQDNSAKGIHTLFMLWASMMVPDDGRMFKWADWMEAFEALNEGMVYAYDVFNGEVFLFSVRFYGQGSHRQTEWGTTVRAGHIGVRETTVDMPGFAGTFRTAFFQRAASDGRQHDLMGSVPLTTLELCYALLGVAPGDDRETIKKAYRMLARRYHPDTNPDENAHEQMQKLNQAYDTILRSLE